MMRAFSVASICALAIVLGAAAASSQTREQVPEPGWIPAVTAGFEVFDWNSENSVENQINGPFLDVRGDDEIRMYAMTFGGELAGPPMIAVPGRPRLVLGGGVGFVLPTADRLIDEGEVASATEPERDISAYESRLITSIRRNCLENPTRIPPKPENCPRLDLLDVDGQGNDVRLSFDSVTWHAKLGASFDLPVLDDAAIQISPAIAYRGERVKLQGRLTTVTLDQFVLPPRATPPAPQLPAIVDTTIHRSRPGAKNAVHHHLGPSLELGVVLSRRARPIRTTVFFHVSYLWLLSDPDEDLEDLGGVATYRIRRESQAVRGGVGVRFSWLGFRAQ